VNFFFEVGRLDSIAVDVNCCYSFATADLFASNLARKLLQLPIEMWYSQSTGAFWRQRALFQLQYVLPPIVCEPLVFRHQLSFCKQRIMP
jgi:hypothetical protein